MVARKYRARRFDGSSATTRRNESRLGEPTEPDQEVGQLLGERRIVGVGLHGAPVHLDRLFALVERLRVDGAERAPGAVVVGVQVDGRGQTRDRLVPRLGLDREAPEKELRLGQPGLTLGQAQQRAPRAVVRLLLDLEPRQHQVGLLRVGAERDGALQLRFSLGVLALGTQELGERHARVDLIRSQLDGAPGRAHRLVHVVDAHEQLGVLRPERG